MKKTIYAFIIAAFLFSNSIAIPAYSEEFQESDSAGLSNLKESLNKDFNNDGASNKAGESVNNSNNEAANELITSGNSSKSDDSSLESVIKKVRSAGSADEFNEAVTLLNDLIEKSKDDSEISLLKGELGKIYFKKGDFANAIKTFQELLTKASEDEAAKFNKIISYLERSSKKAGLQTSAQEALDKMNETKTKLDSISWTHPIDKASAECSYLAAAAEYKIKQAAYEAFDIGEELIFEDDLIENYLENKGCKPIVTGAFFQLASGHNDENDYPVSYWKKELTAMKEIGMDTAIVQYTHDHDNSFMPATERILTAADEVGIKVFVGTILDESTSWYLVDKFNESWLEKEAEKVASYATDMVRKLKNHSSFVGVYIPYEDNTLSLAGPVGDFYNKVVQAVKKEDSNLLTLISPFTCLQPGRALSFPKAVLERYYKIMLAHAKVDICAWQDGVGGTTNQLTRIENDLGAIAKACKADGITLWANVEVFHRTTPLNEAFEAKGTDIGILKQQVSKEHSYVSKIICFDFNHYFSPNIGEESAKKLYEDYKTYYGTQTRAK